MPKYRELARAKIGEGRQVVVSERIDGLVSIAQAVTSQTDLGPVEAFMKNAIIMGSDGLDQLITALQRARDVCAEKNMTEGA